MKKLFILTMACFFAFACSSDDDNAETPINNGTATFNGKEVLLEFGHLQQLLPDLNPLPLETDLTIFSVGFTTAEVNGITNVIGGKGSKICISLMSSKAKELSPGKYQYNVQSPDESFEWTSAEYISQIDYTSVSGNPDDAHMDFNKGYVIVEKVGNNYNIDFSLANSNDQILTGKYSGPLQWLP